LVYSFAFRCQSSEKALESKNLRVQKREIRIPRIDYQRLLCLLELNIFPKTSINLSLKKAKYFQLETIREIFQKL